MPGYVHASVAEEGWSPRADLWALVRSFTDTLGALIEKSDPRAYEKLSAFIEDPDNIPHGLDYLSYFDPNPKEAVTEIPAAVAEAFVSSWAGSLAGEGPLLIAFGVVTP